MLRQDNADLRLRRYGYELGLINEGQYDRFLKREQDIERGLLRLQQTHLEYNGKSTTFARLLCRPEYSYQKLVRDFEEKVPDFGDEVNTSIEIDLKYAGYILREKKEAKKLDALDEVKIPSLFDYSQVIGLRNEAREKLIRFRPYSLGQASRIDGVSPADISILMVSLKK